MQILDRLKMELSNQEYFSDEQYTQFLLENGLSAVAEYNKETDQRQMLLSALDILEAVSNDIDIMRQTITEFTTTHKHINTLRKEYRILEIRLRLSQSQKRNIHAFHLCIQVRILRYTRLLIMDHAESLNLTLTL